MRRARFALGGLSVIALAAACAAHPASVGPVAPPLASSGVAASSASASASAPLAAPSAPARDPATSLARGDGGPIDAELSAGDRAYDADDLVAAKASYEAGAKKAPRDPAPIVGLTRVALAQANVPTSAGAAPHSAIVKQAIDDLHRAAALDARFLPALVDLGHVLLVQGDADAAVGVLRNALLVGPGSAEAHSSLGVALLALGAKEEAIRELARAVALEPGEATRHTNLGKALISAGRVVDAMSELARVMELAPNDPRAASDLAVLRLSAGDVDGAMPLLERAIKLEPKRATFHVNLSYARILKGDLDGAVLAAKQALALDPRIASGWINLGIALARQKKLAEAKKAFEKAQELDPTDPRPRTNLDELKSLEPTKKRLARAPFSCPGNAVVPRERAARPRAAFVEMR